VVTGATGNIGTALMAELLVTTGVSSVLGLSRRPPPEGWLADAEWRQVDVLGNDLEDAFRGADAVVHLAWLFQPTHRPELTWRVNVNGTKRVLEAAAGTGVGALVVASSVGAYSPRHSLTPVDESWPTDGVPTAAYSREKAYVERLLDVFRYEHPGIRVVRMRTAFVFQRASATEQRRLFLGPLVPAALLLRRGRIPFLPDIGGELVLQAVHAADAARAYRQALLRPVDGAFNIAADPVIDMPELARRLGVPARRVPFRPARAAVTLAWGAHLVPAAPGLLDLVRQLPVMATGRAREVLDWQPHLSGLDAITEFLDGLRDGDDGPTPPLASATSGRLRRHEFATGIGSRP
jgi:UDP-glucose 4-epimerase